MSSKGREPDKRISFATEKHAGEFLFSSKDMDDSQFMDMRTRIVSEDTMKGLLFYGILSERLKCDAATELKDLMERMLIARDGTGRAEAVMILRQNLPRVREVDKGTEGMNIDKGTE
jgi:hypothetical protein